MRVRVCNNNLEWKKAVLSLYSAHFLQSFEWGEFQEKQGVKPLRILVEDEQDLCAAFQGFIYPLIGKLTFVYFPRIEVKNPKIWKEVLDWLKSKNYVFCRVEPNKSIVKSEYKENIVRNRQPAHTLLLNLTDSEENILKKMHKKTRYNIRLAQKKGVLIKKEKNAAVFANLNSETTQRDNFKSHHKDYYKGFLELPLSTQFIAYFEGIPIASIICVEYGDTYTYVHGASGNLHRNVMAPYALQWEAIKNAKNKGYKYYDFWGIAPEPLNNEVSTDFHEHTWIVDHPWSGITRFKVGFGGERKNYPNAYEVVLRQIWYNAYNKANAIRNRIRV